jgi:histone acetyltransferase 1
LYLANPPKEYAPPGEVIESYSVGEKTYNVYKSSLLDEATVTLVERLQIFVLLFIEGGSYIDTTDIKWQIFLLYLPTRLLLH